MKRLLSLLVACFFVIPAFSQEWRDSLMEARRLYKNGNYTESLKYYRSAEKLAPEDMDFSQEEGLSAFRARQYPYAEKSFSRAASKQTDPKKKGSAYNNEGYARMKQQNYAGAEESFKNALRADPNNEKARQNLAEARRIRKQNEEKQKQCQNPNQNQQNNQNGSGQKQQQQNGQQKNQQQSQQQQGSSSEGGQQGKVQPKLGDKQTDRKLDELMRQEMRTKKSLDGTKQGNHEGGAKKDW